MKIPQLILASQSPQRQKLLATLGIDFTVVPADIDEKSVADNRLEFRAQSIALAKAQKVATVYPEAIILAADTFTVLNNKILRSPKP
jgi:septum formation protein